MNECEEYVSCNEDCKLRWCNKTCAEKDGYKFEDDEPSCKFCRKEDIEDSELLKYLLNSQEITRGELLRNYL
jgi:hypothetical protein